MIPPCHARMLGRTRNTGACSQVPNTSQTQQHWALTRIIHSFVRSLHTAKVSVTLHHLSLSFKGGIMGGTEHVRQQKVRSGAKRLDRHAGSGRLGTPKKGGAGGKHTWGIAATNAADAEFLVTDKMDPNYQDSEDDSVDYTPSMMLGKRAFERNLMKPIVFSSTMTCCF